MTDGEFTDALLQLGFRFNDGTKWSWIGEEEEGYSARRTFYHPKTRLHVETLFNSRYASYWRFGETPQQVKRGDAVDVIRAMTRMGL